MINHPVKLATQTAAALTLASALALSAYAQSGRTAPATSASRPGGMGEVLRNEMHREMVMRELEEGGKRAAPARDRQRPVFARTAEDFRRIQIINNELVAAASRVEGLDFKLVAKSVSEIRKRAQRLKLDLALPVPEPADQTPPPPPAVGGAAGDLKPTLLAFGKLVAGFAHNPVFREANVVDAQLSARARRDLEEIIETAAWMAKTSERLDKAARKSQ